jgi:hypothetical protein
MKSNGEKSENYLDLRNNILKNLYKSHYLSSLISSQKATFGDSFHLCFQASFTEHLRYHYIIGLRNGARNRFLTAISLVS